MRRTKKFRGHRTHGRGKKAGRGAGKRGGRGNAGLHKHKWTWTVKYDPFHFGRHGFKRHPSLVKRPETINIKDLAELVRKLGTKEINLHEMGYEKLLGAGKISEPVKVMVKEASARAVEKIEKAGGSVVLLGENTGNGEKEE